MTGIYFTLPLVPSVSFLEEHFAGLAGKKRDGWQVPHQLRIC